MRPIETKTESDDEIEEARVIACDSLLHAASTERKATSALTPGSDNRGLSRLRVLLSLLEAAEIDADARSAPTGVAQARDGDRERPLLGRFEVLDHLGSGGFGFVVRARDRLLGREVALKMPLPERLLAPGDVDRFLKEARAAARLDHPNIMRVFDAGELGPLGYFIASEYCDGPNLRLWLSRQTEPVPARLAARWIATLAGALEHAHSRGILHRDIKPDNIMLAGGPQADDFVLRLTDFGLAKLTEETGAQTRSDARLGTPHYMAPEQAAGRHAEISPATDIYALGATFYEVLTGRPPYRGENDAETVRLVIEADPLSLRSLRPALPRDLETICLKCLRKEPARRYASALGLRADLQRFLDGRPIHGRPVSNWERAGRWARRRPAATALVALTALLTCSSVVGALAWSRWLEGHNRRLETQIDRTYQARTAAQRRRLDDRHRHVGSLRRAKAALDAHQTELAQDILHQLATESGGSQFRDFAWSYLWREANREFTQLWGHEATVNNLVISSDGNTLVTRDINNKSLVWDLAREMNLEKPSATLSYAATVDSPLVWWVYSGDVRYVANLSWAPKRAEIELFDTTSGRKLTRFEGDPSEHPRGLAFDSQSKRLVFAAERPDGRILVRWWIICNGTPETHSWLLEPGDLLPTVPSPLRFIPLVRGKRTHFVDLRTGKPRAVLDESNLSGPGFAQLSAYSADGRFFAAQTQMNKILIWEGSSGTKLAQFEMPGAFKMVMSPHGDNLAVIDERGGVTILDRLLKQQRILFSGSATPDLPSYRLSFSSDETLLAISAFTVPGGRQPAEVWDVAASRRLHVFPGRADVEDLGFVPGSRSVVLAGGSKPRIWRLDPPAAPEALTGHADESWASAFSPDGRVLATGSDDTDEPQTIKLWDPASGRLLAGWKGHTATITSLAFTPDGRRLASSSLDSGQAESPNVIIWETASRQPVAILRGHEGPVRSLAYSPDGKFLATVGDDLSVRLWDTKNYTTRDVLNGHGARLSSVVFSPSSQRLATGSNDATARIWEVRSGVLQATLSDVANVNAVAFAPDGALVATANENGQIKLWNPVTSECVLTSHGAVDQLRALVFTRDGSNIVAAGKDKVVRVWDIITGQEVLSLPGHNAQINSLALSPDGSILASCSHDGAVKLWRAEPIEVVPRQ